MLPIFYWKMNKLMKGKEKKKEKRREKRYLERFVATRAGIPELILTFGLLFALE